MDSGKFRKMLDQLQLPNECKLEENTDLDWMWADPQCTTFLNWLTDHVDGSNVVTPEERKQ